MAITVTPDMTEISLCEDDTGWSAGGTNDAFVKQGTYCLGIKVSLTEGALITYTFSSPVDMSNGEHIYFWVCIQGLPDTVVAGGIRLYVETDGSNFGYFNVGGVENYPVAGSAIALIPGLRPLRGPVRSIRLVWTRSACGSRSPQRPLRRIASGTPYATAGAW